MITRINEWLAIRITVALGTMWCLYLFIILCVMPILTPKWMETILYVSNCFQLCFLPALMVGQALLGRSAETRAQQDHETVMDSHEKIIDAIAELSSMHSELHVAVTKLGGTVEVDIEQSNGH